MSRIYLKLVNLVYLSLPMTGAVVLFVRLKEQSSSENTKVSIVTFQLSDYQFWMARFVNKAVNSVGSEQLIFK